MDFHWFAWLFAVSVTLHNLEEAVWLPAWSQTAGKWHRPVDASAFRFAVAVLTLLAYAAVLLAVTQGKESAGAYFLPGYALAMLLNVLFPHVLAAAVMRRYAPGMLTALLFNLPVTVFLLRRSLEEGYIQLPTFAWAGPLVVILILLSIPLLFAVGGHLPGSAAARRFPK